MSKSVVGPLTGINVLELGQFIAGPYCGTILSYFGANCIKIEPLGDGDQLRKFRDVDSTGTAYWWYSLGRNKKSVCVDLRKPKGQEIVKNLAKASDVLIENFKPGTMEKWNLGSEDLKKINPDLIYSAISGYGRTGPYSSRPGFASVAEAMGGFRYVNGFPDRPSVRPNLSMGDTLAGLNAALGTILALYARDSVKLKQHGVRGQVVDTAIYEAVFGIMEGVLCDYSGAGIVREPSGSTLTGIVPSNIYKTKDGKQVVIGANGDQLFKRLMTMIGKPEIANDPKYKDNQGRVKHQPFLDSTIEQWTQSLTAKEVMDKVEKCQVPNGLIYSIADICEDEQYKARGQLESVHIEKTNKELLIPAIGPKLSETPGQTRFPGRSVGQDTDAVLSEMLNFTPQDLKQLRNEGIIA